jgi:hypothetical protein
MWTKESFDQALLGFRLWTVSEQGVLQSLTMQANWLPGENQAICTQGWYERRPRFPFAHHAPVKRCQCGFHAYHRLDDVREHAAGLHRTLRLDCVLGAVAGWGKVQVHPDGFRAERCQILALSARRLDDAPQLFIAAQRYNVEVLGLQELASPSSYQGAAPVPFDLESGPLIGGIEK